MLVNFWSIYLGLSLFLPLSIAETILSSFSFKGENRLGENRVVSSRRKQGCVSLGVVTPQVMDHGQLAREPHTTPHTTPGPTLPWHSLWQEVPGTR